MMNIKLFLGLIFAIFMLSVANNKAQKAGLFSKEVFVQQGDSLNYQILSQKVDSSKMYVMGISMGGIGAL